MCVLIGTFQGWITVFAWQAAVSSIFFQIATVGICSPRARQHLQTVTLVSFTISFDMSLNTDMVPTSAYTRPSNTELPNLLSF